MVIHDLHKSGLDAIKSELGGRTALELFGYARSAYLDHYGLAKAPETDEKLYLLLKHIGTDLGVAPYDVWGSPKFQLGYRATRPEHLEILGLDSKHVEEAEHAVASHRIMSLLPYNAVMGPETMGKFLPRHPEKFSGSGRWRHSLDPYGLFRDMDCVVAVDESGRKNYLATRKFDYAVLANVTEACPIGCDDCYKGSMVRLALAALADVYPEYAEIRKELVHEEERAVRQAELLTRWLNQNPEVNTVVSSGGEPALFDNHALERILDHYKNAEHVKVVRLCTSAVYQGMWYRIDDNFTRMLYDFEHETGKQFAINAHVTDDHQLSAPEAKMAVDRLQGNGISVHLQMPVQQGINFWRDDLSRSVDTFRRICQLAYKTGVVPYKAIIDMHSPSHPDLTVPIETFTKVIGFLDSHDRNSDMERWQAYNVLYEGGNIYLSPCPHFTAGKEIGDDGRVTYYIPKVEFGNGKRVVVHTYTEPLISGHNDNPDSLSPIADVDVRGKISEVKNAHHLLQSAVEKLEARDLSPQDLAKEIYELEKSFYEISGIHFPKNKPLHI